jgi:uncharacterized MnhB-related membrane protein
MSILVLQIFILVMVGVGGTAVVLTRDPLKQIIVLGFYGLLLGLMFFIYQAPDVALSQIVVGAVALPLMVMLSLVRVRRKPQ